MKTKSRSRRNSQGQFRRSYREALAPLFWLSAGLLLLAFIWVYFQKSEVIGPCDDGGCKFFIVRAVELPQNDEVIEIIAFHDPQPTTQPETVKETEITGIEAYKHYIIKVFGEEEGQKAIKIISECENGRWNPRATNWNRNGTWDTGLFQINQVHGRSLEDMQDPIKNIDQAYKVYKNAGNSFHPWSCSHVIDVTPFYLR